MNLAVTVALLPALFLGDGGPDGPIDVRAGRAAPVQAAAVTGEGNVAVLGPNELAAAAATTTTTTTAPPPPRPKVAPKPRVAVKAAAPVPTTTTTAKPRPTTTTTAPPAPAPAPSGRTESGKASWYDHQPGICAHKTLPFGTVVTVHAVNGKSVQCTVGDRGPFVEGYVIDLHWREFEQLTSRDAGRIDVTITW